VALRPDLVEHFRLIEEKRTGPARIRLRRIIDADGEDGQAAFLFGLSYHREKRYGLARPWFELAARHAPDYDVVHHFHGWCLYYLGEADAARAAFERHVALRPDTGDSHFALGLLALDDDRIEDAEARFDEALALFEAQGPAKDLSKTLTRRAEILIRRGDLEGARDDLVRAADLYPDHYEAHYKLIRLHLRFEEQEAAEASMAAFIAAHERVHPTTSFPE
jgi:tetratricopeptide (TPR) repeat protein